MLSTDPAVALCVAYAEPSLHICRTDALCFCGLTRAAAVSPLSMIAFFETLNGHGAELHATHLILLSAILFFMRADRDGHDGYKLFETYWTDFESSFWAQGQRRGRLVKPRKEWFLQTTLQAALGEEVEIGPSLRTIPPLCIS